MLMIHSYILHIQLGRKTGAKRAGQGFVPARLPRVVTADPDLQGKMFLNMARASHLQLSLGLHGIAVHVVDERREVAEGCVPPHVLGLVIPRTVDKVLPVVIEALLPL